MNKHPAEARGCGQKLQRWGPLCGRNQETHFSSQQADRREEWKNLPDGGRAGAKAQQYCVCGALRARCRKEPKE